MKKKEVIGNIKNESSTWTEKVKPSLTTDNILSAAIQSIPCIGGALNQLIYGTITEIRLKNMEETVKNIEEYMNKSNEEDIDGEWAKSPESLKLFKELILKIELENNKEKIKILSSAFSRFYFKENSNENNKYIVLAIISELTYRQLKLLKLVSTLNEEEINVAGQGLTQMAKGVKIDVFNTVLQTKYIDLSFNTNIEAEILEAKGLIKILGGKIVAVSSLGKLVAKFIDEIIL